MQLNASDVKIKEKKKDFLYEKHVKYFENFFIDKEEDASTFYMKLNCVYYVVTSCILLKQERIIEKERVMEFVQSCNNEDGGYGPYPGFGSNITSTLSAIQICIMLDKFDALDVDALTKFILSLQQSDGSFLFDLFGEKDTRCIFCAVLSLYFLGRLDSMSKNHCISYIQSCLNFDGAYGAITSAESHAAQVYCCVGSLILLKQRTLIKDEQLGLWLCERQCESGGFNGRPEKLPDACYSWWAVASLFMIGKGEWFDHNKLVSYLMVCQDEDVGGFTDRPGNMTDPFHTVFSITGLSLMKMFPEEIEPVNPLVCMPKKIIDKYFPELNRICK